MKTYKNRPQKLVRIGPNFFFFHSQSSPAHSPKLIFHIINMSQDSSVSLSVFKAFKKFLLKEKLQMKFNCSSFTLNMTRIPIPIWNWNRSICLCQLINFIFNCLRNRIIQSLGQIQSCLISIWTLYKYRVDQQCCPGGNYPETPRRLRKFVMEEWGS